jgi:hypothetical protein
MLNERLGAAKAVAAELFSAEAEVEDAIVRASRLAIAIVEGRKSAKLPITTGQQGLGHVVRATANLVDARAEIGAAHAAFHADQIDIGLKAVAFGELWECPDNPKKPSLAGGGANAA